MFDFPSDDIFVYVKADALLSILAPIIEDYTKEVGGVIAGDIEKQWIENYRESAITVRSAYPSMTAKRRRSSLEITNQEAYDRVFLTPNAMSFNVLGEYHSHPKGNTGLSSVDKEYIRMSRNLNVFSLQSFPCSWVELVIGIKKESSEKKDPSSKWWNKQKSIKIFGRVNIKRGYRFRLTIAAHAFFREAHPSQNEFIELPVYLENCSSFEQG